MADEQALGFLQDLERADETLSAAEAEIDELAADVERVRLRATELDELIVRLPIGRARLEDELTDAALQAADALRAKDEARDVQAAAEGGRSDGAKAEARRGVIRTRDALRMAVRRVAEVDDETTELEAAGANAIHEAAELEARARQLAAAFRGHPRLPEQAGSEPAAGLAGVVEWGTAARAALLVAYGGLSSEREAVIRQANELGGVLLGEPLLAATPATVRRRVESGSN